MSRQMSRSDIRGKLPPEARTALLEYDIDALERLIKEMAQSQRRIQHLLTGVLISVATGAVLLAINILVAAAKP